MIAIDTNILVRVLTNDDPAQAKRAVRLIENNEIFIPKTVVLETEWVLRYAYGISRKSIIKAIQKFLGLSNVLIENPQIVFEALNWYDKGFDFADALHLSSSSKAAQFATYDKKFIKKASGLTRIRLREP